nr:MAG TPA: hypothetical protein [Bacteriophage sp.]
MCNSKDDIKFTATFSDDDKGRDFKVGLENVISKDGVSTSVEYDVFKKDVEAKLDSEIGSFSYSTDKKTNIKIEIPTKG